MSLDFKLLLNTDYSKFKIKWISKKKSISLLSKIIRFQKKPLNYIIGYVITSPQPSLDNLGRYYESEDYISHTDSVLRESITS
jgi:hypothetical protein